MSIYIYILYIYKINILFYMNFYYYDLSTKTLLTLTNLTNRQIIILNWFQVKIKLHWW